MINLIPAQGKKSVIREYWIRMVSVWAFLFTGVCIVAILLLVPAYVLLNFQLSALQGDIQKNSSSDEEFIAAEKEVRLANDTISQLAVAQPELSISEVIREVTDIATMGILLRKIDIKREDDFGIKTFQVQGTAVSREELAQFKTTLERSPLFDTVVLPIADLTLDADLPFAITIGVVQVKK